MIADFFHYKQSQDPYNLISSFKLNENFLRKGNFQEIDQDILNLFGYCMKEMTPDQKLN